jgi:elongation factor 3
MASTQGNVDVQGVTSLLETLKVGDGNATSLVQAVTAQPAIIEQACSSLFEQASLTGKGTEVTTATNALKALEALAAQCCVIAEPFLITNAKIVLVAASHKDKNVRAAAECAMKELVANMCADSARQLLPELLAFADAGDGSYGFQTRVLALNTVASLGDAAPEQLSFSLPTVIPVLSAPMADPKKDVAKAATAAMTASCDVIGNRDIEHMTANIVRSVVTPADTPEIMHKLAGVTFVQSVSASALAMVVPLLLRGLRSNLTATRRQSAVIIDNMSKLIDEPIDAAPFLPTLLPEVEKAADAMSDPEARKICERGVAQLKGLSIECDMAIKGTTLADVAIVAKYIKDKKPNGSAAINAVALTHIAQLACSLMERRKFEEEDWADIKKYLSIHIGEAHATTLMTNMRPACKEMVKFVVPVDDDEDDAEELCNCQFTLAYGTKILLHNTTMRLKRGHKYGLLGGNDSGKTTLMRAIANGSVEGFPDPAEVRTVFVEADIMGELSHLSCIDYIMSDPRLAGLDQKQVLEVMATVGFTEDGKAKPFHGVSTLSGGWRMKLAMARAMLQNADILLLDEPTNHLDVINVAWVKNYINSLTNVTAIMVSHDKSFLNECTTDILHIERLKLKHVKGNLDNFIAMNADAAKGFFSIKESKLKFKFPDPGPIDGIKSRSKALMKMGGCDFTYPGNTKPTLFNISCQVSMASRIGCVGENGAGKSTMIKVLTGEVVPQTGDVWRHPNARVAYVAQHAFHHIEDHLDKTPNEYIRWRYSNGEDKESLVKVSMVAGEEELALMRAPFEVVWRDDDGSQRKQNKVVVELTGARREIKGKEFEYDVKYRDGSEHPPLPLKQLIKQGWGKACKAVDARIAQTSGLVMRALSSANVEEHLNDCGLAPEFATHYRMSALSGGQKVKVVLAACTWMQPHILILDEPTNYLDRESLGALANAIRDFKGGVVIISHNNEFVSTLCPEEWVMDAGHMTTKGESGWMDKQDDKISDQVQITTMTDALGNTSEIPQEKKKLTKVEEKKMIKAMRKKIKDGDDLDDEEFEFATEHNLL